MGERPAIRFRGAAMNLRAGSCFCGLVAFARVVAVTVRKLPNAFLDRDHMNAEHEKEVNIIVNGRPKKVNQTVISFEEVVALAFNPVPPNAFFTVTYSHGNQGGSLTSGNSVPIRNGMKFDVTETGQS